MRAALATILLLAACSSDENPLGGEELDDGYIRFRADPVPVAPGETVQYVHWVSNPLDREMDIVAIRGSQTTGGHHAILYASKDIEPRGTNRLWSPADQIAARFIGGAGGEGVSNGNEIPEGAVFRIPAGSAFYIQTHYLNTGDVALEASSYVDIKIVDPLPDVVPLSMFVVGTITIDVPPGDSSLTMDCVLQEDMPMVMYVNHVHETGASVKTVHHAVDGTVSMVKDDPTWNYEWSTAPNFAEHPLAQPLMLSKGTKIVTQCNWHNTTDKTYKFPDEMCAFLGFYTGTRDRACANGMWLEI